MRRYTFIAATAAALVLSGCVQTSHRNVIPNDPGERTSRVGLAVSATTQGTPAPAIVFTGAVGIPGNAEVGFSSDRVFLTNLIFRNGDAAVSSSFDFGISREVVFDYTGDDPFIVARFEPAVGHQFLLQFGDGGRTRASIGALLHYGGSLTVTELEYESRAVSGNLFIEIGRRYPGGLEFSARIVHEEGLAPTREDLDIDRGTQFLVALSWD